MNRPGADATESPLRRLAGWLKRLFGRAGGRSGLLSGERRVRVQHGRFREILNLNDSLLQLFAELQEKASGRASFALQPVMDRIQRGLMDGFVLVKDLNQLADRRYPELYDVLATLGEALKQGQTQPVDVATCLVTGPLLGLRRADSWLVGSKMAALGEVSSLGVAVPDGFVATTAAFFQFIEHNGLDKAVRDLDGVYETRGYEALEQSAGELQDAIVHGELPRELEKAILAGWDRLPPGEHPTMAVRSSAVAEDTIGASHAGQYLTELYVGREGLARAYRRVVASAFGSHAVIYRYQHGLTGREAAMAVGFVRMLAPRLSGVLLTSDYQEARTGRMRLSVVRGLADKLVSGRSSEGERVLDPGDAPEGGDAWFGPGELRRLVHAGRRLEEHFGSPQDIEWALSVGGVLHVLQSRPVACVNVPVAAGNAEETQGEVLLSGGQIACPGVGRGNVVLAEAPRSLQDVPEGCVLALRQASSSVAFLFPRCSAVLTEVGSPSSHMAILCRESGLPALVGIPGLFARLKEGQPVIVDALRKKVCAGPRELTPSRSQAPAALAASPAVARLREWTARIVPLDLTDPASPDFRADRCRTLHDLVRFVHEKLYEVMFGFGERAARTSETSWKLKVNLPLSIHVTDLGGGLLRVPGHGEELEQRDISCSPFRSLLEGLTDLRIDWAKPRAVSAGGFMSVLAASMTGPPAEARNLDLPSFAVIDHQYLSFSARAGYHFSVIETVCSAVDSKNFIQYRFGGGGAGEERRVRRATFLWRVLTALGFIVQLNGDLVSAKLFKVPEPEIQDRLKTLGRLTLCSRQLDMLMDSDSSPEMFASDFLADRFERF
ncbi:MAG: hypothetical protein HY815_16415 [Candidatus Riflebacteria bacterium]|nr:hypothetical protein [Candidatus Riflebacteria bacterium]